MNWNFLTAAATTAANNTETTTAELTGFAKIWANWSMPIILIAVFAIMYFLMIRPQKKQQKKDAEMRNNLSVGDDIITIGGIMGKIVTVKEDSVIIETGSDKNKMRILRSAISRVVPANETQR